MLLPYYQSTDRFFTLLQGDSLSIMPSFEFKFDMIFADPPYFLSNNGLTIQSGKITSVNKGDWDKSITLDELNKFNRTWLRLAKDKLKEDGTIWITGTSHNIFSIGQILNELGFKILNFITWEKTNPPPNFSCRYFTHAAEHIIWAKPNPKTSHFYNYELMKAYNGNKQMKDVWSLPAIAPWEKSCGKHPTQKPLTLLSRMILASTQDNAWVLDPFAGSSTTGIAANLLHRKFVGIEKESNFLQLSQQRRQEIDNAQTAQLYLNKIQKTYSQTVR
jgi:site-specific DNA-methyltransferase (adenine-specific)